MQPGEYMLTVHTWADGSGYVSSDVKAHEWVKYLKDENKLAKTQNYQPKLTYLAQVYTYDLDDIKQEVHIKIDNLKKEIVELENQLAIASEAFFTFRNAYKKAIEELEQSSRKSENSTLYYMILDTVKSRYPYC
jgi:glutamyl-tRNA reductase